MTLVSILLIIGIVFANDHYPNKSIIEPSFKGWSIALFISLLFGIFNSFFLIESPNDLEFKIVYSLLITISGGFGLYGLYGFFCMRFGKPILSFLFLILYIIVESIITYYIKPLVMTVDPIYSLLIIIPIFIINIFSYILVTFTFKKLFNSIKYGKLLTLFMLILLIGSGKMLDIINHKIIWYE